MTCPTAEWLIAQIQHNAANPDNKGGIMTTDCPARTSTCQAPAFCYPDHCHSLAEYKADRALYIQAQDARFMGGWGAFGFSVKLLVQDFGVALLGGAAICLMAGGIILIISPFLR